MYTRLTKIVRDENGRDCVTCVNFGTERCHIHNGVPDCAHCPMLGAIFNQLHVLEDIVDDVTEEHDRMGTEHGQQ